MNRALLLFDGNCGFCTSCATWAQRRLRDADVVPGQRIDVTAFGLNALDVTASAWWVDEERRVHRGHRAIGKALQACGGRWRLTSWLFLIPPFSLAAWTAYGLVARFRHRLPGGTPACRLSSDR